MSLKKKLKKLLSLQKKYHEPDKFLIFIILALIIFGLVSLSSASSVVAYEKFGDVYYYFKHQLFGLIIGLIAFWFFAKVDYHVWQKYAFGFLVFSIFLLLLVFIPGLSANYGKARSWINLFGYSLQPSEFVKISFLLYLAAWLQARREDLHDYARGIGSFVAVLGLIGILMLLQPDVGTLSIIGFTSMIVYFVGGGKVKHILVLIVLGIVAVTALVHINPYQMNRFKCMLEPGFSPDKICYQTNQSLIAVGSGGILGRGFGESRQKYMYLPEVSGDSIFAIIAEEDGLLGSSLLVLAFIFLFIRGYLVSKHAPDEFGRNLAIGIVSWLTIQTLINMGGIINMMPMTGVPLPFVSYGGTAILAVLSACGILVNISKQTKIS
jgi:cell division protein FtsW